MVSIKSRRSRESADSGSYPGKTARLNGRRGTIPIKADRGHVGFWTRGAAVGPALPWLRYGQDLEGPHRERGAPAAGPDDGGQVLPWISTAITTSSATPWPSCTRQRRSTTARGSAGSRRRSPPPATRSPGRQPEHCTGSSTWLTWASCTGPR